MPPSAPDPGDHRPTDRDLVDAWIAGGISACFTVPCSITSTWAGHAAAASREGRWWFQPTNHEGNLPGLAAGWWLGTGRPALLHLQNSGLTHAGDGLISLMSRDVFDTPAAVLTTYRGADDTDDSEPHQAIGRRTDAVIQAIFEDEAVVRGRRDGEDLGAALEEVVSAAGRGRRAVLKVAVGAFRRTSVEPDSGPIPPPFPGTPRAVVARPPIVPARATRDDAVAAIVAAHPGAALLWSNGFTSRAARAVADRPGNFHNVGYMGGTLAIGWSLAMARPDLDIVVVDGDQNAQMGCMAPHVADGLPSNLRWIVLDNRIGASVGGPPSLPIPPWVASLADIVRIEPDVPGSFVHPRVGADGAWFPEPLPAGIGGLAALALRFRAWVDGTLRSRENTLA